MENTMTLSDKAQILLVDDDATQLKLAAYILKKKNLYDVMTVEDASAAFALAQEKIPALIISDYYLAGEDGLSLCKRVKDHPKLRNTMFMLLTAESDIDQKIKALELGADDFISKPFNENEFLSRVQVLLRIKGLQDELLREGDELRDANKILQEHFAGIVDLLAKLIALVFPMRRRMPRRPPSW